MAPRLPPSPAKAPKQQEILTKQQNSFSILHLNYSPFPSAVSARTYNRELLREPRGPPDTHPRLGHPPLGRPRRGRPPRRSGRASRRRQRAQSQEQRAQQRGAVRSHGGDSSVGPRTAAWGPGSPTLSSRPPIPPKPGPPRREGAGQGRARGLAGEAGICPGSGDVWVPTRTDSSGCGRFVDPSSLAETQHRV
jgi:hypothetical protein